MEPCQTGVAAGLVFGSSAIRRSILHFCKNNVFGMKSKAAGIYFSPFQRRKRKNVFFFFTFNFCFCKVSFGRRIHKCLHFNIEQNSLFFSSVKSHNLLLRRLSTNTTKFWAFTLMNTSLGDLLGLWDWRR